MTDPAPSSGPEPNGAPLAGWEAGSDPSGLRAYLQKYRGQFTDEVLTDTAVKAGYADELVRRELTLLSDAAAAGSVRARARVITNVLYLAAYVVLIAGMVARLGQAAIIGTGVLTISLGGAYGLARMWLGRRVKAADAARALPVLLSVPILLWLAIAGLCVWTGAPIPPPAQP